MLVKVINAGTFGTDWYPGNTVIDTDSTTASNMISAGFATATLGSTIPTTNAVSSQTAVASVDIPASSLIYLKSDGTLDLANATAAGKEAIGYVTTAIASGTAGTYYYGTGKITGLSGLTTGSPVYLSTTSGAVTATPPSTIGSGNVVQQVGVAQSATSLLFAPLATTIL